MRKTLAALATTALAIMGTVCVASPASAAPAPNDCWTISNTSSNFEYKCEFALRNLSGKTASQQEAIKQDWFRTATTEFEEFFPFQGCSNVLKVGDTCVLQPGNSPIQVSEMGSNYFVFKSLPGHLEGANRYIKFAFYVLDNELRLGVRAWGPPSLVAKGTVWSGAAADIWGTYASELSTGSTQPL
ncbi:hypothetical protein [Streptomyces sp. BK340]|uniref:hypothetical protein n=1 Tax=Streptomyces sp. BK340 TaxID=2572903 RepID=UPI00119D4DD5|nr:hypothetical protein [Streptomyces sp. BK340]TVZ90412.1 hypothetical protein FB157_11169 [Streptomyces sp. BK340]